MSREKLIVSVKEARKILGSDAVGMSDKEIIEVISTLDVIAKDTLETARKQMKMKRDAADLAQLIHDIYQDKKNLENNSNNKI
jgi:hypothetical protein